MPFNNIISRSGAAALIPEEYSKEIIKRLPQASAAMALFRHVTMSRAQQRLPIMGALPVAYFVNGDTGLKQTTEAAWSNKYLNAEEIACIVPIPETVLDDAAFDIWAETTPFIIEAVGRALDAAVYFGTNKPASWPVSIAKEAETKGNIVKRGTAATAKDPGVVMSDISNLFALLEAEGFDVNGIIAHRRYKGLLRSARGTTGEQLGAMDPGTEVEPSPGGLYGVPVTYPLRGLWPVAAEKAPEMIVGDFTQGILGVRQDLTWKVLDQAVLTDETGKIVYNLAQQDMVGLRVVARFGWEVANVPQPEASANAYPFGVLTN
jgi:HK97 family phage major capsid protein